VSTGLVASSGCEIVPRDTYAAEAGIPPSSDQPASATILPPTFTPAPASQESIAQSRTTAIVRAGAQIVVTYFAPDAAQWLRDEEMRD